MLHLNANLCIVVLIRNECSGGHLCEYLPFGVSFISVNLAHAVESE